MSPNHNFKIDGISIIVPAYNEEKSIQKVIKDINISMKNTSFKYEIIVIDDCSEDKTKIIAKKTGVKVIEHLNNRGYGASLKTGFFEAAYDWGIIIDADGSYPAEMIPELLKYVPKHKMVVGARKGEDVNIPLIRRPAKSILGLLAKYLTEEEIPDLNSGLRVIHKDIVEKNLKIIPNEFSFTTTLTLVALSSGIPIKYIPINYYMRTGKSKIRPFKDTLDFFSLIIRTILFFNPLKIFIPLSLMLFLSSFLVLVFSYLFSPKVMDLTTVILFVAGIQTLSIGLLADLIDRKLK